jgi:hypothetical protein
MKKTELFCFWAFVVALSVAVIGGNAFAASVEVSWNANPPEDGVVNYRVYLGTATGRYVRTENSGLRTMATVSGLQEGVTYHFAVTAMDGVGNESLFSDEAVVRIPDVTPVPVPSPSPTPTPTPSPLPTPTPTPSPSPSPVLPSDADSDGIPDVVENSMGLDPLNPFDSLYDNDLDGFSNYSEYMSKTDMNDFLDYPATEGYVLSLITEVGSSDSIAKFTKSNSLKVVPIAAEYPLPSDLMLKFDSDGRYFYNLVDIYGAVQSKLNVSVTGCILAAGLLTPLDDVSVDDIQTGIELDIPAGSAAVEFEVGIGIGIYQTGQAAVSHKEGYVFDILPYGVNLRQDARIAVPYSGERPYVEIYDFTTDKWSAIKGKAGIENKKAVFYTKTLGRFRLSDESVKKNENDPVAADQEGEEDSSPSGMCFVAVSTT